MQKNSILFAEERKQDIVKLIKKKGKVTVAELGSRYDVSLPTIRNDLAELEKAKRKKTTKKVTKK